MALLPDGYLDAVIALEERNPPDAEQEFKTRASGFLLRLETPYTNEAGETLSRVIAVTNRHVISDGKTVYTRFNNTGDDAPRHVLGLPLDDGRQVWVCHPTFDVAVTVLPIVPLQEAGTDLRMITEENILGFDKMIELGVAVGDEVFAMGFPMGLAGKEKKYAIVRSGIVARLDEEVVRETLGYLIDSSIFPGNSGGPVVLKPAMSSIEGTPAIATAYVIGMVRSYLPYQDVAISLQTERPRITFEENSGLASVVPMNAVLEAARPFLEWAPDQGLSVEGLAQQHPVVMTGEATHPSAGGPSAAPPEEEPA